jgi:hypothetical protein
MPKDRLRYFLCIKGSYYWRPTKRMRAEGFALHRLGKDEVAAKQRAIALNDEWDRHRRGERPTLKIMIYPEGSLGRRTIAR